MCRKIPPHCGALGEVTSNGGTVTDAGFTSSINRKREGFFGQFGGSSSDTYDFTKWIHERIPAYSFSQNEWNNIEINDLRNFFKGKRKGMCIVSDNSCFKNYIVNINHINQDVEILDMEHYHENMVRNSNAPLFCTNKIPEDHNPYYYYDFKLLNKNSLDSVHSNDVFPCLVIPHSHEDYGYNLSNFYKFLSDGFLYFNLFDPYIGKNRELSVSSRFLRLKLYKYSEWDAEIKDKLKKFVQDEICQETFS